MLFTVSPAASGVSEYTILLGDMDLDGQITTTDARIILRMAAKLEEALDDMVTLTADIDLDSEITTTDARRALRMAASLEHYVEYNIIDSGIVKSTSGTFVFTGYGYGHGVGLSQYGSSAMAREGSSYTAILHHYYTGISILDDGSNGTETVYLGSEACFLRDALGRILDAELGPSNPVESRKALTVAIYSIIKLNGGSVTKNNVAWKSAPYTPSAATYAVVDSVLGEYCSYNGKPVNAYFSACSAGRTASASTVWGGYVGYCVPVDSAWDCNSSYYGVEYTISSSELRQKILAYNSGIVLSDYPEEWITITNHDGAVNEYVGYIAQMRVGTTVMKGNSFRSVLGGSNLKSGCFTYRFIPD